MKNLKLLCAALCLLCAAAPAVNAQENGNRDENNKIVRGPYMTNEAGANWWINLGGGITAFGDGGCKTRVTPALDINFGKWFTPSIAVRAGYQGLTGSMWTPHQSLFTSSSDVENGLYKAKFGYAYVHGDFMWNISNAFSGYKETRFWNVIPYLHAGMLVAYKNGGADKEFAAGAGLYNTLRLCDRVAFTLDVRGLLVNGRQFKSAGIAGEISATFGIAVNLGKTNWSREPEQAMDENTLARISELEMANQTLAAEKEELTAAQKELAAANEQLKDENEELSRPVSQQEELAKIIPHSFYFGIGKTQLSKTELSHLDFYISNINSRISEGMTVVLTVRADASTGSQERNEFLNDARINYIKDLLQNKYNLRVDGYELHHEIVKSENPALDRAVEIRFK